MLRDPEVCCLLKAGGISVLRCTPTGTERARTAARPVLPVTSTRPLQFLSQEMTAFYYSNCADLRVGTGKQHSQRKKAQQRSANHSHNTNSSLLGDRCVKFSFQKPSLFMCLNTPVASLPSKMQGQPFQCTQHRKTSLRWRRG